MIFYFLFRSHNYEIAPFAAYSRDEHGKGLKMVRGRDAIISQYANVVKVAECADQNNKRIHHNCRVDYVKFINEGTRHGGDVCVAKGACAVLQNFATGRVVRSTPTVAANSLLSHCNKTLSVGILMPHRVLLLVSSCANFPALGHAHLFANFSSSGPECQLQGRPILLPIILALLSILFGTLIVLCVPVCGCFESFPRCPESFRTAL